MRPFPLNVDVRGAVWGIDEPQPTAPEMVAAANRRTSRMRYFWVSFLRCQKRKPPRNRKTIELA